MAIEPVSPELALVSPELAARARAVLPERPWEAFAPPIRPTGGIIRLAGPVPAPVARAHGRTEQMLAFFPVILLAAFVALLIAGSLPGMTERPTLVPGGGIGAVVPPDGARRSPGAGIDSNGVSNDSPTGGGYRP